jgi:hypothetical protein
MTPDRARELAIIFERASKDQTNIIDPPFDCVSLNMLPSTWAALAELLREHAELVEVAADSRCSSELIGVRVRNVFVN